MVLSFAVTFWVRPRSEQPPRLPQTASVSCPALCCTVLSDSSSEKVFPRMRREPSAPAPIDCKLSSWSEWGPCDPCTHQRFRSRSIEKFGQFGGKPCLETLRDSQSCKTSQVCPEAPEADCGTDFQCDSGRCIKQRLVCNVDNDCGDFSDEDNCESEPRSPCRNHDIDVSEIGMTAGQGINILGMQPLASPFDNDFFNGLCERVRDGNTRTYYRKPWNVGVLIYDTKADKTFTAEYYHDRAEMIREVYIEEKRNFNAGLSVKYTPTEASDKGSVQGNLTYYYSKNSNLSSVLKSNDFTNSKTYIMSGEKKIIFLNIVVIQLGRFQMRSRDVHLTDSFLDDLNFLPAEYDKGEYFKFLEDYGTHYAVSGAVGGKYEFVYVLDDYGYVDIKVSLFSPLCFLSTATYKDDAVIDDVISLVDGGKIDFAVKIKEMLLRGVKTVNIEDYVEWAKSLVDAPVVIQQRPFPIHALVPVKMRDAYVKKQNLERAIEDYITEYSVCKCKPCKNGGTVMLVDGACTCMCSSYFKGIACQIPKSTLIKG
uniref:Complement component C9 n=1 Tax=Nothoprocta perdicaria TaxID=30464 RepID=A0A8C6YQA6_NOTPE